MIYKKELGNIGGFREPQVPGIGLTGQFTTAEYNAIIAAIGSGGFSSFSDAETPSGLINGSNKTFTLANIPASGANPLVSYQGQIQQNGVDFIITSNTITFTTAPQSGTWILVWYRY